MDEYLFSYATASDPAVKRGLIRLVEKATGQPRLKRLYVQNQLSPRPSESFWQAAVRSLALDVRYDAAALARIPRTGPLVVVANHPYGVLDGIVVSWLVEEARSTNLASRAAARAMLEAGGAVVVFPAGGVSTAPDRLGRKPAVDARWQPFVSQLIQRSKATVAPIWFGGQNSRLFQIASHVSQTLRISLIFHEVKARIGADLPVAVGAPIPFEDIAAIKDRQALADHLRALTYALASCAPLHRAKPPPAQRLLHNLSRLRPHRAI